MLVPLGAFAMVAAIVCLPILGLFKHLERRRMHDVVRTAIEKGQTLPPEVVETLTRDVRPVSTSTRDIRTGVIMIAVGIGLAIFGACVGYEEHDVISPALGIASIPTVIGLAYIVLSFFNPNKEKRA
ncbi:MAG TPA: DUF6249 domain-containing protein [Caulobacter sp.]|nr:DUF6249 domain-containing protein [Caulobacter sp.]